jgi:photosystem I reaction center subunit XII
MPLSDSQLVIALFTALVTGIFALRLGRVSAHLHGLEEAALALVRARRVHAREHEHGVLLLHGAHLHARAGVEAGEEERALVRRRRGHAAQRRLQVPLALGGRGGDTPIELELQVEAHVHGRGSQHLRQRRGRAAEAVRGAAARPALHSHTHTR